MSVPQHNEQHDFPAYWDWEKEGTADGQYVRVDEAPSQFGNRPILVLEIGGVERSVWITSEILRSKLAEELDRRGHREFELGERISIRRGTEKRTSAAGREYRPFFVSFGDAPQRDAAGILGANPDTALSPPATPDDEVPSPAPAGEDIPF